MRVLTIRNRKNGFTQQVTEENWNNPRMWPESSKQRFRIVANEDEKAVAGPKAAQKPTVIVPQEIKDFHAQKEKGDS